MVSLLPPDLISLTTETKGEEGERENFFWQESNQVFVLSPREPQAALPSEVLSATGEACPPSWPGEAGGEQQLLVAGTRSFLKCFWMLKESFKLCLETAMESPQQWLGKQQNNSGKALRRPRSLWSKCQRSSRQTSPAFRWDFHPAETSQCEAASAAASPAALVLLRAWQSPEPLPTSPLPHLLRAEPSFDRRC